MDFHNKISKHELVSLEKKYNHKVCYRQPFHTKESCFSLVNGSSNQDIKKDEAPLFWEKCDTKGEGVNVAIIDTGVDKSHSNLQNKVIESMNFASDLKVGFEILDLNDYYEFNYYLRIIYYSNYYRSYYYYYFKQYYPVVQKFLNFLKREHYFPSFNEAYSKSRDEVNSIIYEMQNTYLSILQPFMNLDNTVRIQEVYDLYLEHFEYRGKKIYYENCTTEGNNCFQMHGTHVASICSGNEEDEYTGMAPNSGIYDLCVQSTIIENGLFFIEDALRWISFYGVNKNINVVNMSLGMTMPWGNTENIINDIMDKNIVVLAATGNSQSNESSNNSEFVSYPAGYPNVIAIGSLGREIQDNKTDYDVTSSYSEIGPNIDYCLPGKSIIAAYSNDASKSQDKSIAISGTSMATPYAAGIVCLMISFIKKNNIHVRDQFVRRLNYLLSKITDHVSWQNDYNSRRYLCTRFDKHVGFGRITTTKLCSIYMKDFVEDTMNEMPDNWKLEYIR